MRLRIIRAASVGRNRLMLQVAYGAGLRVSELCGLTWGDVILRDELVQLSVTGKGGRVRQVLLPEALSKQLLALHGDVGDNDPVFQTRSGKPLTPRGVHAMVKRAAARIASKSVSVNFENRIWRQRPTSHS